MPFPDCICRTCIVYPCCRTRYENEKLTETLAAKKIVRECSYFVSHYGPMLQEIKDALKHEGKNADGLTLLIENPFIPREKPPKNYISFR